jgi:hypothetical protein
MTSTHLIFSVCVLSFLLRWVALSPPPPSQLLSASNLFSLTDIFICAAHMTYLSPSSLLSTIQIWPFSGCPVSILDLCFLDFYIVTIFWVTLFLYGKHCFTLLLPLLLLLIWPFLWYFFLSRFWWNSWNYIFFFFLLNGERLLFGLNGGHVIVLLVLAIDDAWEMKKTADWNKVMIESWETFSWVSRKSLKLLNGLLFFSSFISFLLFHYLV